jgi:hypothetical protein
MNICACVDMYQCFNACIFSCLHVHSYVCWHSRLVGAIGGKVIRKAATTLSAYKLDLKAVFKQFDTSGKLSSSVVQ